MAFHLGRPILVMIALAGVAAVANALKPAPPKRDLEFWLFSYLHADTFRGKATTQPSAQPSTQPTLVEIFEKRENRRVDVRLINMRAIETRMLSLMMSDAKGETVPDVFSIDVSSVGKFFRFPPDKIGLYPLEKFLDRPIDPSNPAETWRSRLPANRLATWTRGNHVFGIPYDIHPGLMAYRGDLFDEAGVDLAACRTWEEFHQACIKYRQYWTSKGRPDFFALEASDTNAGALWPMILQRHINLVDSDLKPHLTDPKVVDSVVRYARMVAGPGTIGTASSPGGWNWIKDLEQGALSVFILPDHRIGYLRRSASKDRNGKFLLEGKLRMMPLPVWEPGDARTTTTGGTMAAIPKNAADPEASWKLIEQFYLSDAGLKARAENSDVLPPDKRGWSAARYHQPDPLFSGAKPHELLMELAGEFPAYHATPFSGAAQNALANVLQTQVRMVKAGASDAEQRAQAIKELEEEETYIKRLINFSALQ